MQKKTSRDWLTSVSASFHPLKCQLGHEDVLQPQGNIFTSPVPPPLPSEGENV